MSRITYDEVGAAWGGEEYDWSVVGVWHHDEAFYLGTDSGCSCGYPWESYTDDDLTGPLTAEQAIEEITSLTASDSGYNWYNQESVQELVEEIRSWH